MRIYFAPMEGITTYLYRNLHYKYYGGVDIYFTPFLSPGPNQGMSVKEMRDILPENNGDTPVVPQILTNRAEDFLDGAAKLSDYGYREVNLNLGCPSGTVVSKKKGSGFLSAPEELDRFFDRVFAASMIKDGEVSVSVKTRIGKLSPEEWPELMKIYNRYPLKELIIHPRIQKDFYKNTPNREVFRQALSDSKNPVVYNGDLFSGEAYLRFRNKFPAVETVMLGRGMVQNPALAEEIRRVREKTGARTGNLCGMDHGIVTVKGAGINTRSVLAEESGAAGGEERKRLRAFHDELLSGYREIMSGDRNVLFKMKEIWSYLLLEFPGEKKAGKRLMKAVRMEEYQAAVEEILGDTV